MYILDMAMDDKITLQPSISIPAEFYEILYVECYTYKNEDNIC